MGNAQRIEKRAHHGPLVLKVIGNDQARGEQVRYLDDAPEVPGPLGDRQRHDALRAELDLAGDQGDRFGLLKRGLLIGPKGTGGGNTKVEWHQAPQPGRANLFNRGHI